MAKYSRKKLKTVSFTVRSFVVNFLMLHDIDAMAFSLSSSKDMRLGKTTPSRTLSDGRMSRIWSIISLNFVLSRTIGLFWMWSSTFKKRLIIKLDSLYLESSSSKKILIILGAILVKYFSMLLFQSQELLETASGFWFYWHFQIHFFIFWHDFDIDWGVSNNSQNQHTFGRMILQISSKLYSFY